MAEQSIDFRFPGVGRFVHRSWIVAVVAAVIQFRANSNAISSVCHRHFGERQSILYNQWRYDECQSGFVKKLFLPLIVYEGLLLRPIRGSVAQRTPLSDAKVPFGAKPVAGRRFDHATASG